MDIILKGDHTIPSHDLQACFLGALEETRNYPKEDLVLRFRYSHSEPTRVSVASWAAFGTTILAMGMLQQF